MDVVPEALALRLPVRSVSLNVKLQTTCFPAVKVTSVLQKLPSKLQVTGFVTPEGTLLNV